MIVFAVEVGRGSEKRYIGKNIIVMEDMDLFVKHGILPQEEVLQYFKDKPPGYAEKVLQNTNVLFLTLEDVARAEGKIQEKEGKKEEWGKKVEIVKDITGKSTSKGELEDFIKCFNDRYKSLKKILKRRGELVGSTNIGDIPDRNGREIKTIGIVQDIKQLSNGGKSVEIEDETASISFKCSEKRLADHILLDSVIGVVGTKARSGILYANDVLFPDVIVDRNPVRSDERVLVVFTSDMHIGSKTFLKDKWRNFIEWLNNEAEEARYLVLAGDNVDGVGIYPNQEKDLEITNVYEQYEAFARELDDLRKDLTIIVAPGNHDAVRPAEPQPALSKEIENMFPSNVISVGNPCFFKICRVPILMYHGRSMDDLIHTNLNFNHSKPVEMMIEMLKVRHLSPTYGGKTPIAPENKDYMVIDEVPDIFVTGHVHSFGVGRYRNTLLINGSTWQSQTSYQKMLGFEPNPANIAIVDLRNGNIATKSF